jgi:hypothetical protein
VSGSGLLRVRKLSPAHGNLRPHFVVVTHFPHGRPLTVRRFAEPTACSHLVQSSKISIVSCDAGHLSLESQTLLERVESSSPLRR